MKTLKIIALSVSIFAITGFGLKEWGVLHTLEQWNQGRLRMELAEKSAKAYADLCARESEKQKQEMEKVHEQWVKDGCPSDTTWKDGIEYLYGMPIQQRGMPIQSSRYGRLVPDEDQVN